jgi:hypothetical protein
MIFTIQKTVLGVVRFLGLLTLYVGALTGIGVLIAGRTSYRWLAGSVPKSTAAPTANSSPGETLPEPDSEVSADPANRRID